MNKATMFENAEARFLRRWRLNVFRIQAKTKWADWLDRMLWYALTGETS
jgi:hypothetical protein